jgi:hypothetical protein
MSNSKPLVETEMQVDNNIGSRKIEVSILCYDTNKHQMEPGIHVRYIGNTNDEDNSPNEIAVTVEPSEKWNEDYAQWNCGAGPPVFHYMKELRLFNEKGIELACRLRGELQDENTTVVDFMPLYSNVAVGDAVCGWWHVKDMNYGVVIPIQKLPVSDLLKSRLAAWKYIKGKGWNDPIKRHELDHEAHDLEEHLLWELNVDMVEEGKSEWKFHNCIPLSEINLSGIPKAQAIIPLNDHQVHPVR